MELPCSTWQDKARLMTNHEQLRPCSNVRIATARLYEALRKKSHEVLSNRGATTTKNRLESCILPHKNHLSRFSTAFSPRLDRSIESWCIYTNGKSSECYVGFLPSCLRCGNGSRALPSEEVGSRIGTCSKVEESSTRVANGYIYPSYQPLKSIHSSSSNSLYPKVPFVTVHS